MFTEILEIIRYRELLRNLVLRDLKVRYRGSMLGFLWVMLNPLLIMVTLSVVFSQVFHVTTGNYTIYLLSGIIFWNFFSQTTSIATRSFAANGGLIKKVYLPKSIFPLATIVSGLVNFLLSLVPLYAVLVISTSPSVTGLYAIPLSIVLLLFLSLGLSLILSVTSVFFQDMVHIYEVLLLAWMYATPIFYPESIVPGKYRVILEINPLYYILSMFRSGLYTEGPSLGSHFVHGAALSLGMLVAGYVIYNLYKDKIVYYL